MRYELAPPTGCHRRMMSGGGVPALRSTFRPVGGGKPPPVVNDHGFGTDPAASGTPSTSVPETVTLYRVRVWNAAVWDSVRTVFPPDQLGVSVIEGRMFHVTLPGSIASLNVTTIGVATGTPVAPSAGSVVTICGATHCARNCHGFGGDPVTLSFLFPSKSKHDTVAVYQSHSVSDVVWLRVTRMSPFVQARVNVMPPGFVVITNVPVLIASLKSRMIGAARGTFCWLFAGFVRTRYG